MFQWTFNFGFQMSLLIKHSRNWHLRSYFIFEWLQTPSTLRLLNRYYFFFRFRMTRSPVLQIYFHMHCKKTHINKFKLGSFCRYNLESDTYLKNKCTFYIQGLMYNSLCSLNQFHDPIFYYLVTFFFQLMNHSIEKCQAHLSTANNNKKRCHV